MRTSCGNLVVFEDHDGSFLAHHVGGSLGVSIVEARINGDVYGRGRGYQVGGTTLDSNVGTRRTSDPEILDSPHAQTRVNDIILITQRSHLARPARMIRSPRLFPDVLLPLLVVPRELASLGPGTLDVVLGALALGDDLVDVLDAFGEDCEVKRVREVVVVDEGFVEGV